MRHLVDEALLEKRVLRVIDAAPDTDRYMRVAHGEIDAIVRHVVGHVFEQALKKISVDAELHHARRDGRDDGLAGGPDFPRDQHAMRIETGGHPGGRDRPVEVVADVLLAGQTSFTGWPTSFAIMTACRTKSWKMPRRPKPQPSIIL